MSNLYINIRFGLYHLQLDRDWKITWTRNDVHKGYEQGYFTIYQFFN